MGAVMQGRRPRSGWIKPGRGRGRGSAVSSAAARLSHYFAKPSWVELLSELEPECGQWCVGAGVVVVVAVLDGVVDVELPCDAARAALPPPTNAIPIPASARVRLGSAICTVLSSALPIGDHTGLRRG